MDGFSPNSPMLEPSKISLRTVYGPAGTSLEVFGQFLTSLSHNLAHTQQPVYVVKGLKNNLLGLPANTIAQPSHKISAD